MSKKTGVRAVNAYAVSQNFLTSARTIDGLLRRTTISRADHVLEIGAGKGHITRRLLARAGRVTAVEIDPALSRRIADSLGGTVGFRLIQGDFLKVCLPAYGPYKVFANIPFSRTSAIVEKLSGAPNPPADAWLIMERGAAMRFAGRPAESLHSLALKPFFDVRIVGYLQREGFHPMPSVSAAVLHLHRKERPDISPDERDLFAHFLRAMRGGGGRLLSARQISVALRASGQADIPQSATMAYVQWLCLFRCWRRLNG